MVNQIKSCNYIIFNPRIIKHYISEYTTYLLYHVILKKYEQNVNITFYYLTSLNFYHIILLERQMDYDVENKILKGG